MTGMMVQQSIFGKYTFLKKYGRVLFRILLFGFFFTFYLLAGNRADASSATIRVQVQKETLVKGEDVPVLVTVSSMDPIYGFEAYFSYDSRYLRFVSSGKKVHGNDDTFRIQDVDRSEGTGKMVYAVRFQAKKTGVTAISLKKPYNVIGENNSRMSISYDAAGMVIQDKEDVSRAVEVTAVPRPDAESKDGQPKAEPELPKDIQAPDSENTDETSKTEENELDNELEEKVVHRPDDEIGSVSLRKLSVSGAQLTPAFSPGIQKYSGTLTTSDTTAFVKYKTEDSTADVTIKGNDELKDGKNIVKVVVKNGGKKKTYRIILNVKILKGADKTTANTVTAEKEKGKVYLLGDIAIEAGEAENEMQVPDGFRKIPVEIDGEEVSAYALNGDIDQEYYLLYGKNTDSFYVYDKEKEQLLPYEQVKNWYRSMGGQDLSALEESEKTIESYRYILGIFAAFSGLMFILMLFFALHGRR